MSLLLKRRKIRGDIHLVLDVPDPFDAIAFDVRISCHRSESTIGRKPTSGGSSETDMNEPIVNPTGRSSTVPVTTVTPVGKWPSTAR